MFERLRTIFSSKKIEDITKSNPVNKIQNSTISRTALLLAVFLTACGPFYKPENTNNNNQNTDDAAVDARPLDDGSLDGTIDANIQKDSSLEDAALDSSIPDSSTPDAGSDATVQNDSGPAAENCTNGIDDNNNGMIDCWDPDCSTTANCTGENCQTIADDENDGAAKCMDWECSTTAACQIWHSDCTLQGLNPGEDCATGGMGQCAEGTCSQKSATTPSNCQPKNSACY